MQRRRELGAERSADLAQVVAAAEAVLEPRQCLRRIDRLAQEPAVDGAHQVRPVSQRQQAEARERQQAHRLPDVEILHEGQPAVHDHVE